MACTYLGLLTIGGLESGEATGHSLTGSVFTERCANAWLEACVPAQESVHVPCGRGQPLHSRLDAPQDTGSQGFSPEGRLGTGVACGLEPVCPAHTLPVIKVVKRPAETLGGPQSLHTALPLPLPFGERLAGDEPVVLSSQCLGQGPATMAPRTMPSGWQWWLSTEPF